VTPSASPRNRKRKAGTGRSLKVCELFRSIAGETTHAGRVASFVRLAGCNLRCRWCDTPGAWEGGFAMPIPEILDAVGCRNDRLVVVTGGEPLLQSGTPELLRALVRRGHEVLLETNGSLDIAGVPPGVRTILDLKCPGSGHVDRNLLDNLGRLRTGDELKLVLLDRTDFDWALGLLREHPVPQGVPVLFSPVAGRLDPAALARWMLQTDSGARLQLQLHRLVWPGGEGGERPPGQSSS